MKPFQHEFIRFALHREVLLFGEFTLKSGRVSPYFFNAGLFNSGASLAALGGFYARALLDAGLPFDMLYGPAYKGIPLVAALACALHRDHARDVPWSFNRKEAKDHGESGLVVGAPLAGRVVIIDDVISAGTSARESVHLIHAAGAEPVALCIALDRCERGDGPRSAVQEVREQLGLRVVSIITLDELVEYLQHEPGMHEHLRRVRTYRDRYGASCV